MNLIFRTFVFLGAVFVLLLFAALIAPYFIKWDEFTDEFEREASRIIGQPVKVEGETTVRLLPLPYLEFNGLSAGENPDGSPMMTADQFSLRAELLPFLSGEVRIVEMDMVRPRVDLQVDETGAIGWTRPKELIVNPEQVNIADLNVFDGAMIVSGLTGGRQITLDQIDAQIDAKSLIGPWRVDATAEIEGISTKLKIQTGTYQQQGSIRLKIEADRVDRPYEMLLDGPVQLKNDVLEWSGDFEVKPNSRQEIENMVEPAEPLPVTAAGLFVATPAKIEIPDYRLEVGAKEDPYTITGTGVVTIDEDIFFNAKAFGRQIDLDRIETGEADPNLNTLEARLSAIRSVLERVPVPQIEGEISVVLPALVAGDTFVRELAAIVEPRSDGWDLRTFSAKFPGNTTLEASGRVGLENEFGFDGKILVASRQPSGLAAWISGDVDPTFRKLTSFGIASDLSLSERQATFENMELRMDDAVLKGKMQRISSLVKQPAIILKLAGNRVNVENLRAIYSLVQKPEEKDAVTHDLDVEVTADVLEAVIAGVDVVAGGVDGHVKVRDGSVTIERFNATQFYGSQIESSGRIENLLSRPNGNMQFAVLSENAAELLAFSKAFVGENQYLENLLEDPQLTQDTELSVEIDTTAKGNGSYGQLLAVGKTGGTEIDLKFAFDGLLDPNTEMAVSLVGVLENADPAPFFKQAGIETYSVQGLSETEGPITLDFDVEGPNSSTLDALFSVQLGETNLSAEGTLSTSDWNSFDGDLALTLGSGNIVPHALLVGVKVPGLEEGVNLPLSATLKIAKRDGETRFDGLSGQIAGNSFDGSFVLQEKEVLRPRLGGELRVDRLDAELLAETVFGRNATLATSISEQLGLESDTNNFQNPPYRGYDADIKIKSSNIRYGPIDGKNASLDMVMLDGAVDLQDIAFTTLGGTFNGGVQLKNTDGTVLATLRYELSGADVVEFAQISKLPKEFTGKISIQGTSETSGKSFEALVANLSGNGLADLSQLKVNGLNPGGFDEILLETGVDGYEIVPERIAELIDEAILISSLEIPRLESPFSISNGRMRFRNVTHDLPASDMTGDLEINLAKASLDAELNIVFDPGRRERMDGAEPQVQIFWRGPVGDETRTIDTSPLEGYLSLRAFEQSQRRVETLEARVLETQRLQNEVALAFAQEKYEVRRLEEIIFKESEKESNRLQNASRLFLEDMTRRQDEARAREEERLRLEAERKAREEAERLEAERKAREEAERLEAERKAREEAERLEAERKAREEAERLEAERKAREEAERLEAERKAREEAERLEAERKAREEAERLEAERKAREEAERLEAERRVREEAERLAAEQRAREEAERLEAERLANERQQPPEDEIPVEVQNLLQQNILQNLENFLGAN